MRLGGCLELGLGLRLGLGVADVLELDGAAEAAVAVIGGAGVVCAVTTAVVVAAVASALVQRLDRRCFCLCHYFL